MGIVQRIKEKLADIFPLHTNLAFEARTLSLTLQEVANRTLMEINREFRLENQKLEKALDDAQEEAREERAKKSELKQAIDRAVQGALKEAPADYAEYDLWAQGRAEELADMAYDAFYAYVTQQLSLHKYRRNLHKEITPC